MADARTEVICFTIALQPIDELPPATEPARLNPPLINEITKYLRRRLLEIRKEYRGWSVVEFGPVDDDSA